MGSHHLIAVTISKATNHKSCTSLSNGCTNLHIINASIQHHQPYTSNLSPKAQKSTNETILDYTSTMDLAPNHSGTLIHQDPYLTVKFKWNVINSKGVFLFIEKGHLHKSTLEIKKFETNRDLKIRFLVTNFSLSILNIIFDDLNILFHQTWLSFLVHARHTLSINSKIIFLFPNISYFYCS